LHGIEPLHIFGLRVNFTVLSDLSIERLISYGYLLISNMRKASFLSPEAHCASIVAKSDQPVLIAMIQTDQKSFTAGNELSQIGALNQPQKSEADDMTSNSNYYRDLLLDVFETIRSASQDNQKELLEMIRDYSPVQNIRLYLDRILPDAQAREKDEEAPRRSKKAKPNPGTDAPQFRRQIMDIRYLCGSAPYRVPAKPWTNVTDDDDLVSHLISLYMTWDYPFYAFIDRETFLVHMKNGSLYSDFCTPFLVNAMLANACVSIRVLFLPLIMFNKVYMTGLLAI
jgi:hypothetical protein